jgi:PadR family transcriptional regulator PadR
MSRESLGEFEHLVMLAVLRLGNNAYGVTIIEELEARTGRSVSHAATYLTLRRLQGKGLINSDLGDPRPERGGKAKRFFRIEPAGRTKLRESRAVFMNMWEGVSSEIDAL